MAGPATALALHRAGIESVVLERRPTGDATAGSCLTLAPNGLDALRVLGVLDEVVAEGFASRTNLLYGATGRRLGEVGLGEPMAAGLTALTLKRSALAAVLTAAADRCGVQTRYGAAVTSAEDDGTQVSATLADGSVLTAELLVGADGVHSLVRGLIDPAAPSGRYVGLTNFGGITRSTPLAEELEPQAWHFVFGRRSFFGAHPTPAGDVAWFVNVPEPAISREQRAGTSDEQWRQRLADLVADDAGPAAELVRTGCLELAADNTYDLGHVPTWSRGRMVVIGDAAHAPSPSSGQGASMALEDAVVLAQALRDNADLPRALAAYEAARRRRVEKIVKAGARSSSSKIPGRVGRPIQESVLRLVFRYLVTDRSTGWMNGHRLRWDDRVT